MKLCTSKSLIRFYYIKFKCLLNMTNLPIKIELHMTILPKYTMEFTSTSYMLYSTFSCKNVYGLIPMSIQDQPFHVNCACARRTIHYRYVALTRHYWNHYFLKYPHNIKPALLHTPSMRMTCRSH